MKNGDQRLDLTAEPSRKQLTHDKIVKAASSMIRRNGYGATGVADVMKEAGLTHGGFYAHFDSRDALLAEALDRAARDALEHMRKLVDRATPEEALEVFVEAYLSDEHAVAPEGGCTLAALGTESPRQAPRVREVAARRLKDLVDFVARLLPDWGQSAQHERALGIVGCLVGSMVMARASNDARVSAAIRGAARKFIRAAVA